MSKLTKSAKRLMCKTHLAVTVTALGAALCAPAQAQYKVTILRDPPVAYGRAISGAEAVGDTHLGGEPSRAVLWSGGSSSYVDLTPAGFESAHARDLEGGRQVGWGAFRTGGRWNWRALLWSGSASSFVDLHVPTFDDTVGYGMGDGQQVGAGFPANNPNRYSHALLWSGSAASAVDLHPFGFTSTHANDASGGKQVGFAWNPAGGTGPALWSGSATSYVSLRPAGSDGGGQAYGIAGNQQVGYVVYQGNGHAALWHGSASSFVDLNPPDAGSIAYATNGTQQVGTVDRYSEYERAAVWSGSASSMVDLHQFLSSADYFGSEARGIDAAGNIIGYARGPAGLHPVIWSPVPEPATLLVLGGGLLVGMLRNGLRPFRPR